MTKSVKKNTKRASTAQLNAITVATYNTGRAHDEMLKLVAAAGGLATSGVRDACVAGRLAAALIGSGLKCEDTIDGRIAKAREIMAQPANKRGKTAFRLEGAARTWVSRAFKKLDVAQESKKAGNTNAKRKPAPQQPVAEDKEPAAPKTTPAVPTATNVPELAHHIMFYVSSAETLLKKAGRVKTDNPDHAQALIAMRNMIAGDIKVMRNIATVLEAEKAKA